LDQDEEGEQPKIDHEECAAALKAIRDTFGRYKNHGVESHHSKVVSSGNDSAQMFRFKQ